jgi:hypothetical protein
MMGGMKFQFGIKSILLATAVIAIACSGMLGVRAFAGSATASESPYKEMLVVLVCGAPLWVPFAFVAFAVGRKRLSVMMVVAFAYLESVAYGIAYGVLYFVRGY